jgi:ribosomal protein S18 acetylase RimI-like enzyme
MTALTTNTFGLIAPAECITQRPPVWLNLRPANPGDHRPLCFFFDAVLRKDYFLRRGQLEDMLRSNRHRVLIAELDGILVGAAILTRGCRLVNVLVHPAYRGLRIGRALVEASGATEVRAKLDTSDGNPVDFYTALGFQHTGQFNPTGNIELLRKPARSRPRRDADRPRPGDDSASTTH